MDLRKPSLSRESDRVVLPFALHYCVVHLVSIHELCLANLSVPRCEIEAPQ
jgi:hypothetical protein